VAIVGPGLFTPATPVPTKNTETTSNHYHTETIIFNSN